MNTEAKEKALKQHEKLRDVLLTARNNKEMSLDTYKKIWAEVSFLRFKINNIGTGEGEKQPSTESKCN